MTQKVEQRLHDDVLVMPNIPAAGIFSICSSKEISGKDAQNSFALKQKTALGTKA